MADLVPPGQDEPEIWFPAKTYGWGWGFPVHWKGWVFMIAWMAIFLYGVSELRYQAGTPTFWVFTIVMVTVMIAVCWMKGETPRWRWGRDDD